MTITTSSDWRYYVGLALRLAVVIAVILVAVYFSAWVKQRLGIEIMPHNEAWMHRMILLGLLSYVILTSLPFVPGAEIGMTLLTVFGAQMAPLIYLATILSLMLAYGAGRLASLEATARMLQRLRLERFAAFLETLCATPREERPQMLIDSVNQPALRGLARYRYVALALLINAPGNALIGGGGGLSFVAGLSGVFGVWKFLLTVAIAVLPVPLAVYLFGV
ncbi:hypothetical protein [Marivita hallyeonensis]|uniref:TVP38/TMEM64 family membrane protein n=1 Tax=Marivita hallyeonensis TaxID=996342 RepID=A0A1M5NAK4_9RHOB|nr:hypothetical protein [Marivita hallyeonensis]SHG86574.1 hypothetical protein SAMN05443551_0837 [Marivita hallyeonensis]